MSGDYNMILATSRITHPYHLDYIAKVAKYAEVDTLLLCGDVSVSESFMKEFSHTNLLMVSGDEDDIHVIKLAKKHNVLLDGKVVEVAGVKVGGVGTINTFLDYTALMSNVGRIDVLLTHFPPYGCLDRVPPLYIPSGLKSLRILIETIKPSIVFVGHSPKPTVEYCRGIPVIGVAGYLALADSIKPHNIRFIPVSQSFSLG
ncbi:MAG: hypothetical protein QXG82_01550 [Sulfolobales archaeon]